MSQGWAGKVKIHLLVLVLVTITEFIGIEKLNLGFGSIALFPMLYALILGGIISYPKFGNWIGYGISPIENLPGIAIIVFVSVFGWWLSKVIPLK